MVFVEFGTIVLQASKKFDTHPLTAMRILIQKNELLDMEAKCAPMDVSRVLKGQYADLDRDILEFIGFVRNERLPVTLSLIQTLALLLAKVRQQYYFRASLGWVAKFLRRTGVRHI